MSFFAILLSRVMLSLSLLSSTALCPLGRMRNNQILVTQNKQKKIDYRIGKTIRTTAGPPMLIVYISVKPERFNRQDMLLLARQLNDAFSTEQRVSIWLFDRYSSARDFVPHPHSPTYERDFKALRGHYDLDRVTGKETMQFSSAPNKPRNEIVIDLS